MAETELRRAVGELAELWDKDRSDWLRLAEDAEARSHQGTAGAAYTEAERVGRASTCREHASDLRRLLSSARPGEEGTPREPMKFCSLAWCHVPFKHTHGGSGVGNWFTAYCADVPYAPAPSSSPGPAPDPGAPAIDLDEMAAEIVRLRGENANLRMDLEKARRAEGGTTK